MPVAKYTDSEGSVIKLIFEDGKEFFVPNTMENKHRRFIEEEGIFIEPYEPPIIPPEVKKEQEIVATSGVVDIAEVLSDLLGLLESRAGISLDNAPKAKAWLDKIRQIKKA